jgi:hypothetical protein
MIWAAAIATLLNVFSNRLARVADRVYHLGAVTRNAEDFELVSLTPELTRLHHRSLLLDCAVLLGAVGAGFTCISVVILLLGTLKYASVDEALLGTFVVAVACAIFAIFFFAAEVLMTGKGVRAEATATKRSHN